MNQTVEFDTVLAAYQCIVFPEKKMNFQIINVFAFSILLTLSGSFESAQGQFYDTREDTIAGGVAGAIIGGIIGNQNDETPEGIAIGAALGALAGNAIGQDRNQSYLRERAYRQAAYQRQLQNRAAQQRAFEKAASVQDVISMSQNGIGANVIIAQLQKVGLQQEIGVPQIISMSRAGVPESVIQAMQQLSSPRRSYAYPDSVGQPPATIYRPVAAPVVTVERFVPAYRRPCPPHPRGAYRAYGGFGLQYVR